MVKENFENYVDGKVADIVATAVFHTDTEVIYQDDDGKLFFLTVDDPTAFEIGTVAIVEELTPLDQADEQIKQKISEALRGVENHAV